MTADDDQPFFLWKLFQQLRRRGFAVGPAEYQAVRLALRAGFGLSSRAELLEVCSALWATSREERAVVSALFDQHLPSDWALSSSAASSPAVGSEAGPETVTEPDGSDLTATGGEPELAVPGTTTMSGLPPLTLGELPVLGYGHVFLPQYPVNYRAVAQAWRRLRWPVREGPATELDVDATVRRRSSLGVASPPVLRPRRRNRAKLLLLIDRLGSMAPFHSYVDEVSQAICQAGQLREVAVYYFHNSPLEGAEHSVLDPLKDQLFPSLDLVLPEVPPLTGGTLYSNRELTSPVSASEVIDRHGRGASAVILSDAGAARGRYNLLRLLDTVAFLKGAKDWSRGLVWLNPLPATEWTGSTAAELARHVPMLPMDTSGMHRAVNVLRGQPFTVDRPLAGDARPV